MRLKKIEIIGFKSFADRTVISFDHGITGIVGPNGCGKSNVSDAFRWVLGEQSAKSLRGGKMYDVIFAGTTNRKPLGIAEVTITLTDIGDALPVDYEEVSVTRRLHRSGESEYLLNRQPVRLRDIQGVFLDSGIGKNSFSIFEQGKIDQVINFSPLERRYIFEEAAGILRFLQRKREALRKLDHTNNNMDRVQDIHDEVEKRIEVLEKQAQAARKFQDNKAQLEALEKAVAVAKVEYYSDQITTASKREEEVSSLLEDIQQQTLSFQASLREGREDLFAKEKELQKRQEAVYKARSNKELRSQEKQTQQDRLKETQEKRKKLQEEVKVFRAKGKERSEEKKNIVKQQKECSKELEKSEKNLAVSQEKTSKMASQTESLRGKYQQAQQQRLNLLQQSNQISGELKEKSVRQESNDERISSIEQRKEDLQQTVQALEQSVKQKRIKVDNAVSATERCKRDLSAAEKQRSNIKERLEALENEEELLRRSITELRAREAVLIRLREEMEGFTQGSRKILQEAANNQSSLHQKVCGLYELITPSSGQERSLAAALRPYSQTLVAKTRKDFDSVLGYAKDQGLKDFSLICLEGLASSSSSTKVTDAVPLLEELLDNDIANHFLSNIYCAEDLKSALEVKTLHPNIEVWSDEGVFIDRKNVLFYASQSENNVFLREAELKTLAKDLADKEKKIVQVSENCEELAQQREDIQTRCMELDREIRKVEMTLVEVNFSLQQGTQDLAESQKQLETIAVELQERLQTRKQLVADLQDLQKRHSSFFKKVEEAEKQGGSIEKELAAVEEDQKDQKQSLLAAEVQYKKLYQENQRLLHILDVLGVKEQEGDQQVQRLLQEILTTESFQENLKEQSTKSSTDLSDVEKVLSDAIAKHRELEKQVAENKKALSAIEKQLGEGREKNKRLDKEQMQLNNLIEQAKKVLGNVKEDLYEVHQLTVEKAKEESVPLKEPLDVAEKNLRNLRRLVEQAKDINMTSIDEFEEHKTRYDFLHQQMDDLSGSKNELLEIITQLDGESRTLFIDTFEKIRVNFQKNFGILFNGGEADLRFTQADDVLDAGIEIVAKPPGKQMRSIQLLSGGEKCLTAVALLFAIFEVKSAPFCILDEIDAPLDDTNVDRFLNVVQQFVDRCQFIIITHNKRTMALADQIYGISMQEKGVSKLLTMRFNKDVETKNVERKVELVTS